MSHIHALSHEVIAQIAAGEVIERPAFVVKELIENSLDAGSSEIIINLENNGLKSIEVIDNGHGMSKSDLPLSVMVHHTSKINSADDLVSIASLGFRGEALSSIAAVSNLTVQSRQKNSSAGSVIEVVKHTLLKPRPVGMPIGTMVKVHNLFAHVPARKKFLATSRTQMSHIMHIITDYALMYPHVRFVVMHNKKTLLSLAKNKNLGERIGLLCSKTIAENSIPFSFQSSYIKVRGYIVKPQITTTSSQKQYIFVNGRRVTDKLLSSAVKDSYGTLIEPHVLPIMFLDITVPHNLVDVNVHPRKSEVRFIQSEFVSGAVAEAVTQTLSKNNLTYDFLKSKKDRSVTGSYAGQLLKQTVSSWDVKSRNKNSYARPYQLHNLYIAFEVEGGLLLVDQHAAHERILYEQYLRAFEKEKKLSKSFTLPRPFILELSATDRALIIEYKKVFEEYGFKLQRTGKHIKLLAVAALLKDRPSGELIQELLDELRDRGKTKSVDRQSHLMLTYLACKKSIKAGDALTRDECTRLVKRLFQTKSPYTCPHGRPTHIFVTLDELNSRFKR